MKQRNRFFSEQLSSRLVPLPFSTGKALGTRWSLTTSVQVIIDVFIQLAALFDHPLTVNAQLSST